MNAEGGGLLNLLVPRVITTARAIASFHAAVDHLLWPPPDSTIDQPRIGPDQLVAYALEVPGGARTPKQTFELRRLAALTLERTAHLRRERQTARRPDVLRMTAQTLANPEFPWTFDIVRYVVTLVLRSLYSVDFSPSSIHDFRNAYDSLFRRWDDQVRKRELKSASNAERFLLDVLCMNDDVVRQSDERARKEYWEAFSSERNVLGVIPRSPGRYPGGNAPQLAGRLPDFATLLNLAFGQPVGVEGLDELTGGLLPSTPDADDGVKNGLVTLICGPPGSGKTSLSLTISARMAELGSVVRYVATEENASSLRWRLDASVEPRAKHLWSHLGPSELSPWKFGGDLSIVPGEPPAIKDFAQLVETLSLELSSLSVPRGALRQQHSVMSSVAEDASSDVLQLRPTFRRVVVIDSLTGLGHVDRSELSRLLNRLRDLGVCVFIVGGVKDSDNEGLQYLVDNVLALGFEPEATRRHPLRTLNVGKTRWQASRRGRHVFHLSRGRGCYVCPSLHSVLATAKTLPWISPEASYAAVLGPVQEDGLPGLTVVPSLRRFSQILVYGHGSAGKAGLALLLATMPRVPVTRTGLRRPTLPDAEVGSTRVLVISFLYDEKYYHSQADALFRRHGLEMSSETALTVLAVYPGYLDPETLVAKVRRVVNQGRLEGRPYTGVVIDGVHNLLLQFPLLHPEPLIFPTLFRLFRSERVEVVTTFTFFRAAGVEFGRHEGTLSLADRSRGGDTPSSPGSAVWSSELFFHLLVSSCDYALLMENVGGASTNPQVQLVTSLDARVQEVAPRFTWNSRRFRLSRID